MPRTRNNLDAELKRVIERVAENIRTNSRHAKVIGRLGRKGLVNRLTPPKPIQINPVFLDRFSLEDEETDLDNP